jgi:hypothetical protein
MSVVGTPRTQGLVGRVIGLLVRPKVEWELAAPEPATVQGLFLGYAALLAAVPAVAGIIHGVMPQCFSLFGVSACHTPNPIFVVVGAVLGYVASLAAVFIIGLIIDALAPSFGGEKSQIQAMKVAVYSFTAAWLAGVFIIVPWVGGLLTLLGLYSIYQLYTGLAAVMKSPPDKVIAYTAVVVVLGIVISIVVGAIGGTVAAMGALSSAGAPGGLGGTTVQIGNGNGNGQGSIDLNRLQQGVQQLAQQGQAVQNGGGAQSGQIVAVDPNKLKALLPDNIAGMPRTELTSTTAGNQAISTITATYGSGDSHITLTITDIGAASPLAALAGAVNVQSDTDTATGYDHEHNVNGRMTIEKYDNTSKSGEYSVLVANRFNIDAEGSGVTMDSLKAVVNAVGPDRVDAMAHGG